MSKTFPTAVILITAASWAGFAIWLGLDPAALLPAFGIDRSTPQMLTEVKAFYGGVEMAIAVAMMILWRRGDLFAAPFIGGLTLAGSAMGRCVGLMVDGFSSLHLGFAGLEIVGALFCLAGCIMTSREQRLSLNSPN